MKKTIINIFAALFLVTIVGCSSNNGNENSAGETENATEKEEAAEKSDQTITLGVTPWTSTVPPTKIARLVVEDMGYEVEEVNADVSSIYVGLSRGDISVYMDSWFPAHQNYLDKYSDEVEDTATSYSKASRGWVVPEYMEDINSISDLQGNEDKFNNEFYGIEKGSSTTEANNNAIEAYDLDLKQINSSEGGMLAQAEKNMKSEEPVVFYGWRPHSMFNVYDIKVLEDEKGVFESPSVHVMTNKKLQDQAPDVYEFLSNWSINVDDIEDMIVQIENEDADPTEVAKDWIENNQDKIDEMKGN